MRVIKSLTKTIKFKTISSLLLFSLALLGTNNSFADRTYAVQAGDFLGKIVRKNYPASDDISKEQIIVAILRANPDAFRGGNIHYLKKVDKLILPLEEVIALIPHAEAASTIKEHYKFFKIKKTGTFPSIALPVLPQESSVVVADIDADEEKEEDNKDEEKPSEQEEKELDDTSALEDESISADEAPLDVEKIVETEDDASQPSDLKQDTNAIDQEAENKESRISELEKKKTEQDLTIDQLDSKIKDLEENISRAVAIPETEAETEPLPQEASTVRNDEVSDKEVPAEEAPLFVVEDKQDESQPDVVENNDGKDISPNEKTYVSRFLEKKSNLLFLLLPLLALVGLLFWRRKKYIPVTQDIPEKHNSTDDGSINVLKNHRPEMSDNDSEQDSAIKIDMARAYQDMGYSDAAKEILEEVLQEGSAQQKEMAQALLAVL